MQSIIALRKTTGGPRYVRKLEYVTQHEGAELVVEPNDILALLNARYPVRFIKLELLREGGNASYAAYTNQRKYFLKVVGMAFSDTFQMSVDINLYLQQNNMPVPTIVMTTDHRPCFQAGEHHIILYEFLEMTEIDIKKDAQEAGALLGTLHRVMSAYHGELASHDRAFYLDRYIQILQVKRYPRAGAFAAYGEALWKRVDLLPRGYSHGDLYSGNIARGQDGRLYVLDFDTSCIGFPMYDLALICNQTDYFAYDEQGRSKTAAVYRRVLPEYLKHCLLSGREQDSLYDMLALYHFALQATIIEIYGLDCVDNAFFDKQLAWLNRWQTQDHK